MATVFHAEKAIVVGGGLAGVSACNTVLELGGRVILLDKSAFCGGNSTKATSGINGAGTRTQADHKIADNIEIFTKDCMKGGAKKPALVKVLACNSGDDVNWLVDEFDLDLSLLARLGGHSMPRTHRGKERFPGMTITYALIQMVENIEAKDSNLARIKCKARAHTLIQNDQGAVIGLTYETAGTNFNEYGPVILATGGFGADFGSDSLLSKHRPDLLHLPTTNGEHCTGDGIKMGVSLGAATIDLEWVQVHPTGLVKPDDQDAKVKFLAAEALRGVGGLVFNGEGKRFANELGRRDYVTGEMWKNKGPIRLCLNEAAAKEIHWHCEHYKGRGVMKQMSGEELAKEIGCPMANLVEAHDQHHAASQKQASDPEGKNAPYAAYPDGGSYDKPSGDTGIGKKFFHNVLLGKDVAKQQFHVAIITPVIHYCMGGLLIDDRSRVCKEGDVPIPGLYCAGEVMGGVHGNNRLGGNSLLDCVVYGRVAGREAAKYILGDKLQKRRLCEIAGGMPGEVEKAKSQKPAGTVAKKEKKVKSSGPKLTVEEVAKHTTENDCWVIIQRETDPKPLVLDVTAFLPDHPGGKLAILTFGGKNAAEEFNMVHPPDVVDKYLDPACVLGYIGGDDGDDDDDDSESEDEGGAGFSMEEVAKHTTETDCWVAVNGQVLDVTDFLGDHPGGKLAILTFAGRDATAEFNMVHPPGVVEKYLDPAKVLGAVGVAKTKKKKASSGASGALGEPLLAHAGAESHWYHEENRTAEQYGPFAISIGYTVKEFIKTIFNVVYYFILEICYTIFSAKNFGISGDRTGLTRSALFLVMFIVIHGIGNIHVYPGSQNFNAYTYFLNHPVAWGTLMLPVEIYLLLAGLLHVYVALVRTAKSKSLSMIKTDPWGLSLIISGLVLLGFMIVHLQQFRFAQAEPYYFRSKWMYPFFVDNDETAYPVVAVRDLYKLEFKLFESAHMVLFYEFCAFFFLVHGIQGWNKVANLWVFGGQLPKKHGKKAQILGAIIVGFVWLLYASYPIFCYCFPEKDWEAYHAAQPHPGH